MTREAITRVGDVMTASPHIIDGLASVRDAIGLMRDKHVSSLIIDKRHDDDEYGMVTVHDIAEKVIGIDRSIDRTSVYEIMSKPVLTVNKQMSVKYAMRLLTQFRLSRALVVEHARMVGIVTLSDMAIRYVDANEPDGG
jgi:signal-transduction protein with cAMP-binding, CBS, and nucleotidyltransferase domain